MINRIVLIGNGFDLAHGLKTSYKDFINWYWEKKVDDLRSHKTNCLQDPLCTFKLNYDTSWMAYCYQALCGTNATGAQIVEYMRQEKGLIEISYSPLFKRIIANIETKGWVDIENEYYALLQAIPEKPDYDNPSILNDELDYITLLLSEYLRFAQEKYLTAETIVPELKKHIFAPIKPNDVSVAGKKTYEDFVKRRFAANDSWDDDFRDFLRMYSSSWPEISKSESLVDIEQIQTLASEFGFEEESVKEFLENSWLTLPNAIMFLNFNYTNTANAYMPDEYIFKLNHIHGELSNPKSMIFGYGDEIDAGFNKLQNLNDNDYLRNVKSVRYLEAENYRNLLNFIEKAPYQIFIMGHSCGISDRTLLNTLFEHKNCISIKPFYHQKDGKDNYLDIVQNISRNFTDMKLMRDRVVNKTYCEPMLQISEEQIIN